MRIFRSYLSDLEGLKNSIPKKYFEMANNIARKIPREYSRIGVLDLNDIIQESNLALVTAWGNIKWNYIKSLPKKEQENAIHGYLYKSIELMMQRRIHNQSEGIKTPREWAYMMVQIIDKLMEIRELKQSKRCKEDNNNPISSMV